MNISSIKERVPKLSLVKKNFIYSSILLSANYIIQLIIFPYISRVLGVEKVGVCNFVDSIIGYFALFASMGISTIGIREIAAAKGDKEKLSYVFSNLFLLNTVTTVASSIVLVVVIHTVDSLSGYTNLLYIGLIKLLSNYLLIEWFFRGLEEFRFITVRSVLVKLVYVVLILLFVKTPEDYSIYYLLTVLTIVINAIINMLYSRRYARLSFKAINLKYFTIPFFTIGVYILMNSMYTSFNVAYLGFVAGDVEVGYYTTATKLYTIFISLFGAFTGVMLPRMSALVEQNKKDEFLRLFSKSVNFQLCFSIPVIIYTELFAPEIISFLAGPGYEGAILPMRIVMPLLFVIGYEQILVTQTLLPLKQDKIVLRNSIIGAATGIILNIMLVPMLHSIGSSIVWCACEVVIMLLSQAIVSKTIGAHFDYKCLIKHICINIPLFIVLYPLVNLDIELFFKLLLSGSVFSIYELLVYIISRKHSTI